MNPNSELESKLDEPQCLGDSILQAILDDDSDKLLDLISSHLSDTTSFFLPPISKKLPRYLSNGPSLLSVSCFFASMNCFRLLLNLNPKADKIDSKGRIAIHYASAGGSLEMLRELDQITQSESSTDYLHPVYNYPDHSGMTPMHYAAQFGRLDVIKYLYLKGAELAYHDRSTRRPIHLACLYGHVDVVRFFVENGVPLTDSIGLPTIHCACAGGDVATIEYLISQKVNVNLMYNSIPPIYLAAELGSLGAIKVLVKHKVAFKNFHRKNPPIIVAASNGHLDVVRFFVEQGCDPNLYDSDGYSVLYAAVKAQHVDIVEYLLSKGAHVFVNGRYRKNASKLWLSYAYSPRSYPSFFSIDPIQSIRILDEKMLLLLVNNIDIEKYVMDVSIEPLENYLVKLKSLKLLEILLEHNLITGDCTELYGRLLYCKNMQLVLPLLDHKISFDPDSSYLQMAIVNNSDRSLLNKFLDLGVKFDPENIPTLLSNAILYCNVDIVKYFLELKLVKQNNNYNISLNGLHAEFNCYINFILYLSASPYSTDDYFSDILESETMSTNDSEKLSKLIDIFKLLLDYGLEFASYDPFYMVPEHSILHKKRLRFLLQLYIMIEDVCPQSLNFYHYFPFIIKLLLPVFDSTLTQECLDMYLKHNFSLHSTGKLPDYNDISRLSNSVHDKLQNPEKYTHFSDS